MKLFGEDRKDTFVVAVGWLFADLLLALAMLFLAANTIGIHPPPTPPPVTPVPTRVAIRPSPTSIPHLEQTFHRFTINIDPNGLLSGSQSAINAVIQQVEGQLFLKKRRAGLAIVYGGAPDDSQIGRAENIANKVYNILHDLGKHNKTFTNISQYDPLYLLGGNSNTITIDIFLFAQ